MVHIVDGRLAMSGSGLILDPLSHDRPAGWHRFSPLSWPEHLTLRHVAGGSSARCRKLLLRR